MKISKKHKIALKIIKKYLPEFRFLNTKIFFLKASVFIFPIVYFFLVISFTIVFNPFFVLLLGLIPLWHIYMVYICNFIKYINHEDMEYIERENEVDKILKRKYNLIFTIDFNFCYSIFVEDLTGNKYKIFSSFNTKFLNVHFLKTSIYLISSAVITVASLVIALIVSFTVVRDMAIIVGADLLIIGVIVLCVSMSGFSSGTTTSTSTSDGETLADVINDVNKAGTKEAYGKVFLIRQYYSDMYLNAEMKFRTEDSVQGEYEKILSFETEEEAQKFLDRVKDIDDSYSNAHVYEKWLD